MKSTLIFSIVIIVLLSFFILGCSAPVSEKTTDETKNSSNEMLPDDNGSHTFGFDKIPTYGICTGTLSGDISGWYLIKHKNTGKYLTDWGGSFYLTSLQEDHIWTQAWRFAESVKYKGYYKIINNYDHRIAGHLPDSKKLTVENKNVGGKLVVWQLNDSDNNGTYVIISKYDRKNRHRIYPVIPYGSTVDSNYSVELLKNGDANKFFEIISLGNLSDY